MNNIEVERDPDYEEIHVNQQDGHLSAIKNDGKLMLSNCECIKIYFM